MTHDRGMKEWNDVNSRKQGYMGHRKQDSNDAPQPGCPSTEGPADTKWYLNGSGPSKKACMLYKPVQMFPGCPQRYAMKMVSKWWQPLRKGMP